MSYKGLCNQGFKCGTRHHRDSTVCPMNPNPQLKVAKQTKSVIKQTPRQEAKTIVKFLAEMSKIVDTKPKLLEPYLQYKTWLKNNVNSSKKFSITDFRQMESLSSLTLKDPAYTEMRKIQELKGEGITTWLGYGWIKGKKNGSKVEFPVLRRKVNTETNELEELEMHPLLSSHMSDNVTIGSIESAVRQIKGDENFSWSNNGTKKSWIVNHNVCVYQQEKMASTEASRDLERWASSPDDLSETALYSLYNENGELNKGDSEIESLLPLNAEQKEALLKSRVNKISSVSGPPGCGKSHLVAAMAVDSVLQGEKVLIATQNEHAQKAILEILEKTSTPPYLVFGNKQTETLDAQMRRNANIEMTEEEKIVLRTYEKKYGFQRSNIIASLEIEEDVEKALLGAGTLHYVDEIGSLFRSNDLDKLKVEKILGELETNINVGEVSKWQQFKLNRKNKVLRKLVGANETVPLNVIRESFERIKSNDRMVKMMHQGGSSLDDNFSLLSELSQQIAVLKKKEYNERIKMSSNMKTLDAVRAIETRNWYDQEAKFLDAAPLWIGTLNEIEEMLPNRPGMFDKVILDEASQISQMSSAPALLRSKRAVIVGDPKQLNHVSFLAHENIEKSFDEMSVPEKFRGVLNVRDESIFDAAKAYPTTWLDEHFRSTPHLINFSNENFYEGNLRLMTAHPANEKEDAIKLLKTAGKREKGVNKQEVEEVIGIIKQKKEQQHGSVGVISPYRSQVDAIEKRVLEEFTLQEIRDMNLRVSTVHGFQGSERDSIVASLAVDDVKPQNLRFIQNNNLFNVMVTRAKKEMEIVHSFEPNSLPNGNLRRFFEHSSGHEHYSNSSALKREWSKQLENLLHDTEQRVITNYKAGGHIIDIVVGEGNNAVAVETAVHPEGPEAHIERRLALQRAGWTVIDAFQSKWNLEEMEAVMHIINTIENK